jgi:hypothetical protein
MGEQNQVGSRNPCTGVLLLLVVRSCTMTRTEISRLRLLAVPVWANVVVVIYAILMAAGGMIAMVKPALLLAPQAQINDAVRIYAGYLTARNLTLAVMMLVLLVVGARRALGNLVAVVGFIQIMDFGVDCAEARWTVAPGVLVLGILLLVTASRISGSAFWHRAAWN